MWIKIFDTYIIRATYMFTNKPACFVVKSSLMLSEDLAVAGLITNLKHIKGTFPLRTPERYFIYNTYAMFPIFLEKGTQGENERTRDNGRVRRYIQETWKELQTEMKREETVNERHRGGGGLLEGERWRGTETGINRLRERERERERETGRETEYR